MELRLYHATNTPIGYFGITKKTMYFTSSLKIAEDWGKEHYDDFQIITTVVDSDLVEEFKGIVGRERYINHDFEQLEIIDNLISKEYWESAQYPIVSHKDCSDGYIVKDLNDIELSYL